MRSIGVCFGKMAWICGHMLPLKPLVSTVLRTTGMSKTRAAFERATLLLMIAWRSKFGDAEEHLRLEVDQRDDAVVGREQSFFTTLRASLFLCHDFSLKMAASGTRF